MEKKNPPKMIKHNGQLYELDLERTAALQRQLKRKASARRPVARRLADSRSVEAPATPSGPFERKHLRAFARAINKSTLGGRSKKYVARLVADVIARYQKDFESDKFIGAALR